jgi:mono/diheme cytochrome c family protein
MALATGVLLLLLSIVFAARADEDTSRVAERGEAVYREAKCQACHSIGGVGSKRYPLDGVGTKLSPDDIRKWIVAPREMNPKVIKPRFESLSAEDLTALVAYLTSLR